MQELDENITPYVLENTPPVLTVGYRCMEMGYTFMWPTAQEPYFIRPDGVVIRLTVEDYIPYLVPNSSHCKLSKPSGTRVFCTHSASVSMRNQSGALDRFIDWDRPNSKIKKSRDPPVDPIANQFKMMRFRSSSNQIRTFQILLAQTMHSHLRMPKT